MKWQYAQEGQALTVVALTIALLLTLILGVNEVSLRRRTMARIQNSLEMAGLAALNELESASLIAGTPRLSFQADETFRATLRMELRRAASALTDDPETLADRATVQIVAPNGTCAGQVVASVAICAQLSATIQGGIGRYPVTMSSSTQWRTR